MSFLLRKILEKKMLSIVDGQQTVFGALSIKNLLQDGCLVLQFQIYNNTTISFQMIGLGFFSSSDKAFLVISLAWFWVLLYRTA